MDDVRLTRQQISDAVEAHGWCLILGAIYAEVLTPTLAEAAQVAMVAASAADAHSHLSVHVRPDRAVLRLQTAGWVSGRDIETAHAVSAALTAKGWRPSAGGGSVQALEIAIDALDIPAVRPFWRAVTGYVDEPESELDGALVDPTGRAPAIWFQQMDSPRPQRNRIHLDVDVPHEAAAARIDAALAAGGRLLSDAAAPAYWVLADPEGNEACICTWQNRD